MNMAEILSAKCTVCRKVFEGENCVAKAEEHEKIPVEEPKFEVGDLIVNIDNDNYISVYKIKHIVPNSFNHEAVYNTAYTFDNSFKLQTKEIEGVKTLDKVDLLNNPAYCDLRNKIIEIEIDNIIKRILQNKNKYEINNILNYEPED